MITSAAVGLLMISLAIWCISVVQFIRFLRYCDRFQQIVVPEAVLPRAGVILCIRGADETLADCLQALLRQSYPDFTLSIVVDSEADPGWELVLKLKRSNPSRSIRVTTLRQRHPECSLKCSAMIQGCRELDSSHRVLAFIDADVVPHATWLLELVQPLLDPRVGATTGTRWCAPVSNSVGAAVRTVWNSCMVTVMQQQSICWGGSMAIRRETMSRIDLLERWKVSFNDDVLVSEKVREAGLELCFVPSLFMTHRDPCQLSGLLEFVRRQLIHVRLTHSHWPVMVVLGFCSSGVIPAALFLLLSAAIVSNGPAVFIVLATIMFYVGSRVISYRTLEHRVLRVLEKRGEQISELDQRLWWAIPMAASLHLVAQMGALLARKVLWRGITYQIHKGRRVLVTEISSPEPLVFSFSESMTPEGANSRADAA